MRWTRGRACRSRSTPATSTTGVSPYVRARRDGDSILVEVAGNRCLSVEHRLSKQARRHLRGLGLAKPDAAAPGYVARYPSSHVDQAASVAVSAFRVAFDVVHPAFLRSDDFTWPTDSDLPTPTAVPDVPVAVHPADREHLDLLIDQAIAQRLGYAPPRDSDGDMPITAGTAVVFVRSQENAPVVRLFAEMVVQISDLDAAAREVGDLNREFEGVKFTLHGDRVVASADLLAHPFAPDQLCLLIDIMCEVVSSHDAALARRVGGRVFLDPPDAPDDVVDMESPTAEDDIHPVMLSILQLDAEKPRVALAQDRSQALWPRHRPPP